MLNVLKASAKDCPNVWEEEKQDFDNISLVLHF